ncbi:unnamed protein product [Arctogadus glacialis]
MCSLDNTAELGEVMGVDWSANGPALSSVIRVRRSADLAGHSDTTTPVVKDHTTALTLRPLLQKVSGRPEPRRALWVEPSRNEGQQGARCKEAPFSALHHLYIQRSTNSLEREPNLELMKWPHSMGQTEQDRGLWRGTAEENTEKHAS